MNQMTEHIGYKKCQDNKIVMLEILGDNNENRKDIIDKNYAKYRCSKAKVLDIYDMNDRSKKFNNAFGIHDEKFEYIAGTIIEPKNGFDPNLKEVCSSGIHYFLTEEPAYFYQRYYHIDGPYKSWYDNGQIMTDCTYKDRKYDGSYKDYIENGQIMKDFTYKDGKLDGPYKLYYENGQIRIDCTYKDGKKDGMYKSYYENGQTMKECTYKNGELDGSYKEYFENGQIDAEYGYKDEKLDGLYKLYYSNGRVRFVCTCKYGKLDGLYETYDKDGEINEVRTYNNGILVE